MPRQAFLIDNIDNQELKYTYFDQKKTFCKPTHDFTEI